MPAAGTVGVAETAEAEPPVPAPAEAAAIAMLLYSYSRAYGTNAQPTIGLRYEPFWITGPLLIRKD